MVHAEAFMPDEWYLEALAVGKAPTFELDQWTNTKETRGITVQVSQAWGLPDAKLEVIITRYTKNNIVETE